MKTFTLTLLFCALISASCEKLSEKPESIYGTWKLVQALNDPGNGSGKYEDVPGAYHITFHSNGSAESTVPMFGLHMLKSYEVIDSVQLAVSFAEQSSQPRSKLWYQIKSDTLTLSPTCIEPCGIKFVRQ